MEVRYRGRVCGLGGRGFNLVTEDCGPSRERGRPEDELGRSGWLHTGGRHRGVVGTLFCSVDVRRPLKTR